MNMGNADPSPEIEIERLRQALEAETCLRLETQRQLARANTEFEEFISLAAHNLREPLRDVAAFSQLLEESYAGRLDSDAAACLDRIRQGAASIQSVLAAVVDYWVTGAGGRRPSPTDMNAVLCQALLRADKQITGLGAVVTHDSLPRVYGDFEILAKALHHLIGNAIIFGGTPVPRVHISCKRVEPGWEISVQDNGPGIAPEFQDRIFGAFKRLHGREYPGDGLGLAFCKKAIEGLGGRISIESTLGSGSTFSFTLPAA
jgi:light-regulated signal transduction histidine kinase (bacteriophytochrome)